jgi:hypothetical protein
MNVRMRIHHNNECENACTPHTYLPGHRVMISQHQERKYKGPYTLDSVNDDGTLCLSVPKGNGTVYETWNILHYAKSCACFSSNVK